MLYALLWLAAPPVDDIVSKAAAVLARGPAHAVCASESEQIRLSKTDVVEGRERAAFVRTFTAGKLSDGMPTQRWRDDQPLSAEQVAEINGRATTPRDDTLDRQLRSPLLTRAVETFQLVREESLWGHHAYVLQVTASKPEGANGTLWIDADTFLELKGELTPQTPPSNVDTLSWQEQFMALADGSVVRSLIHLEGRGHFFFFKAATRFNERVVSCTL